MLNPKIRPRAVVGYGVKIFHPSPPNYFTRSPGKNPARSVENFWELICTSEEVFMYLHNVSTLSPFKPFKRELILSYLFPLIFSFCHIYLKKKKLNEYRYSYITASDLINRHTVNIDCLSEEPPSK